MANNNDEQIVLGLDTQKTIRQINGDIQKLQNQLKHITIISELDTNTILEQINSQIATIQGKLSEINIAANVDTEKAQKTGLKLGETISEHIQSAIDNINILETKKGSLGNTKISINSSVKDFFNGNFFKKESVLSDDDIRALQAYNAELEKVIGYETIDGQVKPITTSAQTAFNRTMREASVEAQNMASSTNGLAVDLEQIPKVSKAGQLALKGLATVGSSIANMAISYALNKLVEGIQYLTSANERYLEKQKEIITNAEETISATESQISSLENLKKKLDETNGSQTMMNSLANEINDTLGIGTSKILEQSNAYDILNAKLEREIRLQKEKTEQAEKERRNAEYKTAVNTEFENSGFGSDWTFDELRNHKTYDFKNGNKLWTKTTQEYFDELAAEARKNGNSLNSTEDYAKLWRKALEKSNNRNNNDKLSISSENEIEDGFEEILSHYRSAFTNIIANSDSFLTSTDQFNIVDQLVLNGMTDANEINNVLSTINGYAEPINQAFERYYNSLIDNISGNENVAYNSVVKEFDELKKAYPQITSILDDYFNNMTEYYSDKANSFSNMGDNALFTKVFNSLTEDIQKDLKNLSLSGEISTSVLESTEKYRQLLEDTGITAEDAVEKIRKISLGESTLADIMSQIQSSAKLINTIETEISENGQISFDTLQSISEKYPTLEQYIRNYLNGVAGSKADLINKLKEAYQIDLKNYDEYYKTKQGNDQTWWKNYVDHCETWVRYYAETYGYDLRNYSNYFEAKQALEDISSLYKEDDYGNNKFEAGMAGILNKVTGSTTTLGGQLRTKNNQLTKVLNEIITKFEDSLNSNGISDEFLTIDFTSDSSSSDFDKDTSQAYDWIEIKINRLNDALDSVKTKADNTYSSWTKRNTELANAISKTKEAIDLQSQAYTRYMQEADSVGLSDNYKKLVQSGAIDISTISDETLKDKISEYQTWYEKAQECLKTQEDLNSELNELNTQKFDNIKSEYDSVIDRMQSAYDLLENQITLLSSSGDYDTLRNKQADIVNKLQSERNALQNNLNSSGIQQYTEEWYNLISQIDDLDSQILDAEKALKDIDNLQFDNIKEAFDFDTSVLEHGLQTIQNKIDLLELKGQFANESYYNGMIEYTQRQLDTLKNERAQLQSILNNTLYKQGTSEWNNMYSTLMDIDEEIDSMTNNLVDFNNAIRDLNWEIFEYLEESLNRITEETDYYVELLSKKHLFDENGQITNYGTTSMALHAAAYDVYKQQAQDYYEEVQDLQKQLVNGAGEDVLEQYNDMVEAHRNAVLAAEDEKQSILDLIEDGYNAQLDALQRLIDKKKEQLNAEKNLYDYQKSIAEKADNISSLEKQKLAYEGDTSEEAMSKIQQIKVQLEEAKADLKESEYEQYLSDTETMLDQLAEDYEDWMNERLDHSDELIAEIIGKIALQSDMINTTLEETSKYYGTFVSDSLSTIFSSDSPFTQSLTSGLSNVSNSLNSGLGGVSTSIAGTTTAINNLVSQIANLVNADAGKTNAGSNVAANNNSTNNTGSINNSSSNISSGNSAVSKPSTTSSNTNKNTTTTDSSLSNPTTSSTSSSSNTAKTGKSLLDSILISKKDYYPKTSLNIETSVVDMLKYNDKDSSFSARATYWSKIFGGTYTGSSAQNTKLLNYLKSNGYKSGTSNAAKGYHWTQEDGEEIIYRTSDGAMLTPLSDGDMVFDNEASKRLWELANNPKAFMKKYNITPSIISAMIPQNTLNSAVSNLCNITNDMPYANTPPMNIGDINITCNEVNNAEELMDDVVNGLIKNGRFEKAMFASINHAITGKGTALDKLKYTR